MNYKDVVGVYAIVADDKKVIYVGRSENILRRMAEHIASKAFPKGKEYKYSVMNKLESMGHELHFKILYHSPSTAPWDFSCQEAFYIQKYKPVLNTQYPDIENPKRFEINNDALSITAEDIHYELS